ncbi:MAG: AAA-type ATPase lid domain-containing protein [Pirellulaceae bacterium]
MPALAAHFLKKFCEENGRAIPSISPETLHLLLDHPWPGNVRELENVMHRISVLSTAATITPADLPRELGSQTPAVTVAVPKTSQELKDRKKEAREKSAEVMERAFVLEALQRNAWNVSRAAAEVHMQRSNFQALMRRYQIVRPPKN